MPLKDDSQNMKMLVEHSFVHCCLFINYFLKRILVLGDNSSNGNYLIDIFLRLRYEARGVRSGVVFRVLNFENLYSLGTGHSCCTFWLLNK